jgi:hypothetical protein
MAQAHNADDLAAVDALLHDERFSMGDIRFDRERRVVEIPFEGDPPRVLQISRVVSLTSEDPDGLVEHSYARLVSTGRDGLRLISNFPGYVAFSVDAIDVTVRG